MVVEHSSYGRGRQTLRFQQAQNHGHLCSIGFRQAAALAIDNLEHGLSVDTEFFPGRKPDECPGILEDLAYIEKSVEVEGPEVRETIRDLVAHHRPELLVWP